LKLLLTSGALLLPSMQSLRMADCVFNDRRKVEERRLGDVFVVGEFDEVAGKCDVGGT